MEERIAVLEVKVEALQNQNKAILEKLDAIQQQLTRYKGFFGGIIFVVSCIATVVTMVIEYVRHT